MIHLRTVAVAALATMLVSAPVGAQRREGKTETKKLEITLSSAVRFGKTVLAKNRYRVSVTTKGLSFANPKTMVHVATIPVLEKDLRKSVVKPTAKVVSRKGKVELVVKIRNKLYYAKGSVEKQLQPQKRSVTLAGKSDIQLGQVLPDEKSDRELVESALNKRYLREVKHCGEQAERSHWTTDDRRFWNCVCPITERWRLPAVKSPLRVHPFIIKGRAGLTLSVTPKGKATDCRVWVGAQPPHEPGAEAEATPESNE